MRFREFLAEFMVSNSTSREEYDGTMLWLNAKKHKPLKSLGEFDLYKEKDLYFLVRDKKYVAHIDVTHDKLLGKKAGFINAAYATERGTYKILLQGVLKSGLHYIVSDALLSDDAASFWKKILKDSSLNKVVLLDNEDLLHDKKDFSKEEIHQIINNDRITIGLKK